MFDVERDAAIEIHLHGRADQRGGQQRHAKQKTVKPVSLTRAVKWSGARLSPTVFGIERIRRRRKILG